MSCICRLDANEKIHSDLKNKQKIFKLKYWEKYNNQYFHKQNMVKMIIFVSS